MQNISIARFKPGEVTTIRTECDADGKELSRTEFDPHGGYVEGSRDDGTRWVVFIAPDGTPQYFYPHRAEDGIVSGDVVFLS
ncbi:hypothetical protein [Nocardia gipuzkoensis]|uniref:hypothetical protein n=1 Tax=Nocardia gipuzkoensis TaxID=2749991 RepID=UPI00237D4EC3|nr:hypothetical protein [Nocardia gipuzkoensis]MDE1673841.1 hypothetical protein [Nocardia gipuzkoensis]